MTSNPAKAFWLSLVVLLVLHSVISFASYRFFTTNTPEPGDDTPVDITTPEQRAAGETSIQIVTSRTTTPLPVIFYIYGGFIALGLVILFTVYDQLRSH